MRDIQFYRTQSGRSPVEDFLDSLSGSQAAKIAWVLQLVEELDPVPIQYFKKLTNTEDLWEVRIQVGRNTFRLLGFFDGSQLVVLNHAFTKKSQKIPKSDITVAEGRKRDYFRRRLK